MRILIYAPIVHSEAEMGSLRESIRRGFLDAFGEDEWARRTAAVEAMWDGLTARLAAMPLAWTHVRLYQDGLPLCGHELAIVRDVAAAGSRNHRLLLDLVERGASLMGTEDPHLMIREYRRSLALAKAVTEELPESEVRSLQREGDDILAERDGFIARRIEETLGDGETGIAFLGMLHRVDEKVAGGIQVQQLIHSLPFGPGKHEKRK